MFYVLRPERSKGLGCDHRSSVTAKRFIAHDDGLQWYVEMRCNPVRVPRQVHCAMPECLGGVGFNAPIAYD